MGEGGRLMSVDARLVKDVLVGEIVRRAEEHEKRGAAQALADPMAALGYCVRLAEAELFEPARTPTPGLAEELEERTLQELCRELAAAEPPGRPDPADGAPSWRVPGPGGHVRHYVAERAAERRSPDADRAEAKREFMYGFFLRCCEEVV
jgi:hypothetical protein